MAKIIFLGTNGWFDSQTGNTVSALVKTKDFNVVLDAGNGIAKLFRYIDDEKPTYLFISHFHLDHVEGLHTICLNKFSKGLNIIVHKSGTEILNNLMELPYMVPIRMLDFNVKIIEAGENCCNLPFKASFLTLQHAPVTQGMRFEADGDTIAYCLDTGYCENAVALAKNADLLILECTLKSNTPSKTHLNPELCARIAQESGTRKLALTHFEAKSYLDMQTRTEAEQIVKKLYENSFMCRDGMEIDL
jgi:ribonuclease BN (tRNA processing enzyme)